MSRVMARVLTEASIVGLAFGLVAVMLGVTPWVVWLCAPAWGVAIGLAHAWSTP